GIPPHPGGAELGAAGGRHAARRGGMEKRFWMLVVGCWKQTTNNQQLKSTPLSDTIVFQKQKAPLARGLF
ncbi:MAG: hypothetical protein ACYC6M_13795, partial [Terriglobales bacterium]